MKSLSPSIALVLLISFSILLISQSGFLANASPQLNHIGEATGPNNQVDAVKIETLKQPEVRIVQWQPSSEEKPAWLKRNEANDMQSKIEEAIRDRLQNRIDVSFDQKPLSAAIKFFSDEIKAPILIDENALQEQNISPDEPITLELINAKCSNALEIILDPLELTYIIHREVLTVTTKKMSANVVRSYDLSHFMPDNSLSEEVVQLIEQMVTPDEWMTAGGTSSLLMFGSMLVVSAPESSHMAIEDLLRSVSRQSRENMKPRRRTMFPKGMMGGFGSGAGAGGAGGGMMSVETQ